MKKLLFLGTKDKSDLLMYLSQVLNYLDYRVLIIDGTENQRFIKSYTRFEDICKLYDFHGVDIVSANCIDACNNLIKLKDSKDVNSYDFILVDTDTIGNWPTFDFKFYVGSHEKINLLDDAELVKQFVKKEDNEYHKIIFSVESDVDEDYFDKLINHAIKWSPLQFMIYFDEFDIANKINMQFNMSPSFRRLSRAYRRTIADLITTIAGHHRKDTRNAMKSINNGKGSF